jgi:hypothetical protein
VDKQIRITVGGHLWASAGGPPSGVSARTDAYTQNYPKIIHPAQSSRQPTSHNFTAELRTPVRPPYRAAEANMRDFAQAKKPMPSERRRAEHAQLSGHGRGADNMRGFAALVPQRRGGERTRQRSEQHAGTLKAAPILCSGP